MRLRQRRRIALAIVIAAMALVAALPAGALAAGEESGGAPTPAETPTESPSGTTEPAPSSPGSTGWTPVGDGGGSSGDGATSVQHGSSLGSGGHTVQHAGSTGDETAAATEEEPSYVGSSAGDYEGEASTRSTSEEAASGHREKSTTHPPAPPPPVHKAVDVALGAGIPVARPKAPQAGKVSPVSAVPAAPVAHSRDQATSASDALSPVAILLGLCLLFAGWRVGLHLWRRRAQRRHLEVRWSREADWEAVLHRIEQTRAPGTGETANGVPSAGRPPRPDRAAPTAAASNR